MTDITFAQLRAAGFKGTAKRIEDIDLPRIGHMIGVGEDEIHAVIDVEASGSGFDPQGRPKILFERHVFYRNLEGTQRNVAVAKGLAYRDWKPGSYPKDSYPRLIQALEINETAALKACSWGLSQILGENYVAAGYESPQAMVVDFCQDEDNHLEAMVRFIIANHLDDELRAHNWAGFARGYNGASYKVNQYDTKLAAAYLWWRKKPNTPWSPEVEKPVEPVPVPVEPIADETVVTPVRSGPLWDAYVALAAYFREETPMQSKQTPLVGSILIPVVTDVVKDAVIAAAKKATNPLEPEASPEVAIDAAIEAQRDHRLREIEARIENTVESVARTPVAQGGTTASVAGAVVAIVGVAKMLGYDLSDQTEALTVIVAGGVAGLGGLRALYGLVKAHRRLGA
jgi:hypothetical protein